EIDPLRLAALCQEGENQVVGAPCGIMDQVVVTMGRTRGVLPILCRPTACALRILARPPAVHPVVELPGDLEVGGVPTGAEHDVSGVPYRRARAAAFMGKRIIQGTMGVRAAWVSELPIAALTDLPDALDGATFLERWRATDDPLTTVDPDATYPVRAA